MGVKWKNTKNLIPKMEKAAAQLNGRRVNVGVFGEQAWLAGIHEYGCKIEVTDKMRAYLHSQGLHLKDSTKYITIPERAFLRNGYDQSKDGVVDNAEDILPSVLNGGMDTDAFLKMVGLILAAEIKDYAASLDSPPNHPFTVSRKGSSNPLVDTGDMIGSITYEVQ
ncbi:hypothetical protein C0033_08880 [Clostridium sp. chh4-2]|uniref:hypothetical protein n=1 Tax=Clostridium sp. chh4-2 TaxID=2067550 RepID=UPI000CCE3A92|nr:hypothetical protein [Clostridium sp. chh4-2]PNV62217.1 hypothetical protein C0033_08880 [Clostridium sp. chh4-2]